jgi:hypothetical protein
LQRPGHMCKIDVVESWDPRLNGLPGAWLECGRFRLHPGLPSRSCRIERAIFACEFNGPRLRRRDSGVGLVVLC